MSGHVAQRSHGLSFQDVALTIQKYLVLSNLSAHEAFGCIKRPRDLKKMTPGQLINEAAKLKQSSLQWLSRLFFQIRVSSVISGPEKSFNRWSAWWDWNLVDNFSLSSQHFWSVRKSLPENGSTILKAVITTSSKVMTYVQWSQVLRFSLKKYLDSGWLQSKEAGKRLY